MQTKENKTAKDILIVFAQYGFRKTSMQEIGHAAGVSRQSIYKKFGSKEKCYEWTIHTYLSGMYSRIFTALDKDDLPPLKNLINVFDTLIGEAIEIVNNSHGTEILNDVLQATHNSKEDWPLRFRTRLAEFLERNNYVSSDKALGTAFALISAGKGLLLEEASRNQFLKDMTLIIESIVTQEN
ncbi:MAG: TetR/AcrR family transcriptional regulator [Proteobacteria bacterium]|nr:TetR/AcrR family transcriptional regulator [Pseudomonadota bacterium]